MFFLKTKLHPIQRTGVYFYQLRQIETVGLPVAGILVAVFCERNHFVGYPASNGSKIGAVTFGQIIVLEILEHIVLIHLNYTNFNGSKVDGFKINGRG